MRRGSILTYLLPTLMLVATISLASDTRVPETPRSISANKRVDQQLTEALNAKGLRYGAPVFVRIFKQSYELEIWVENDQAQFSLFKTYDICNFSGELGPKLKEGDQQSPEGFYFVPPGRMNPWSQYHLSFNLGYPNRYERHHGRTGSALMVHGNCVSIGCYAMTDDGIEEIYSLAEAALNNGQPFFRVHAFPFRMDNGQLAQHRDSPWYAYWLNLKQGFDYFETHRVPPNVEVTEGQYTFGR